MISLRAYWCIGGAVLAGAAGALLAWFAVPVVPVGAGLALLTLLGIIRVRPVVRHADVFQHLNPEAREQAASWIAAGIVTHMVWVLLVRLRPDQWLVWAGVLVALCALSNVAAVALNFNLSKIHPKEMARREQYSKELVQQQLIAAGGSGEVVTTADGTMVVVPPESPLSKARKAFALRQYDWLEITGWTVIVSGGESIGISYEVQVPAASAGRGANRMTLGGEDVEPLAIAFSRALDMRLQTGWVQITKHPVAGAYTISVTTVDALAKVHPYEDVLEWGSINDPVVIGYTIDGTEVTASLAQHWADTGASRSGKTSLIHTKWAKATLFKDAVLAVGGARKVFDSVGEWLTPYLGTDEELPFLAIANGPLDTAELMVCLMKVAMWRQTVPHHDRADFVDIILQIDEASFLLILNKVTVEYEGVERDTSFLACELVKAFGSAGLWLHLAAQRGTNNNWGDHGGDISANIGTQTVFRTSDAGEVGRATGDYKQPPPTNKGEFLYTTGIGDPVLRVKAPYIQETDPKKPKLHDGVTLPEVSWARRHFKTHLDPRSERVAREASEWYRNRATRADDVYAYLANVTVDLSQFQSPEYTAAFKEASDEVEEMLRAAGIKLKSDSDETTASPAGDPPASAPVDDSVVGGSVSPLARPKTLKDWIEDVAEKSDCPLSRKDIITGLANAGYRPPSGGEVSPQAVTNALRELRDSGRLRHHADQTYESARVSA